METAQEIKEKARRADERFKNAFWARPNESPYQNLIICPRINNCNLYREKESDGLVGFIALYCERHPDACELNPLKENREHEK